MAICSGVLRSAGTRKVKPNLDLLKQQTVGGSGISWATCIGCTSSQDSNYASTPPLSFLQAGCPSCRPTNSIKALKALSTQFSKQTIFVDGTHPSQVLT